MKKILMGLLLISLISLVGCTDDTWEVNSKVPVEYWGTTSLEYGQVDESGLIEFTPEQLKKLAEMED